MLLLIDGSAILHRMYHAHPDLTRSDGLPVGALYGFCNTLWDMRKLQADQIIICWDARDRRCFRHDLSPAYKANRAVRDAELSFQFTSARDAAEAFSIAQIDANGQQGRRQIELPQRHLVNGRPGKVERGAEPFGRIGAEIIDDGLAQDGQQQTLAGGKGARDIQIEQIVQSRLQIVCFGEAFFRLGVFHYVHLRRLLGNIV